MNIMRTHLDHVGVDEDQHEQTEHGGEGGLQHGPCNGAERMPEPLPPVLNAALVVVEADVRNEVDGEADGHQT